MINFKEFIKKMKMEVERRFNGRVTFEVQSFLKSNGTREKGLVIKGIESAMAPIVYLDAYYEAYREGMSLEKLADEIYDMYNTFEKTNFMVEMLGNFEEMRDKVFYKLINYEKNKELLKDTPHKRYLDFAVTFSIMVERNDNGQMTSLIQNKQMKYWGTDTDTLYKLAKVNTSKIFPGRIEIMPDMIRRIEKERLGERYDDEVMEELLTAQTINPLYILSNASFVNGAAVILYENVLKDFADMLECDLVILPSSVHETLLIPYGEELDIGNIKELVKHINGTEVPESDVLSDNVYLYKRESGNILIVE